MAFDSGMLAAVVNEINTRAAGARVEKINQPEKAEIVLTLRTADETLKLCVSASPGCPRILFEREPKENPKVPPSLCMALRKHLSGAKLSGCFLMGFERVVCFSFAARDELGYVCEKRIYAEIMGKSSGFFLCGEDGKILTGSRFVDLSANAERKILPGMKYVLPPSQGKRDPLSETAAGFLSALSASPRELSCERFLRDSYMGISPLVSREITFRAVRKTDAALGEADGAKLFYEFEKVVRAIKDGAFSPTLVRVDGKNVDFTYIPVAQYGEGASLARESFSDLIGEYFSEKNREETARHYAHDVFTVVKNASSKLEKKLDALSRELTECKKKDEYKLCGDLITANMYLLKKGDTLARLTDYGAEGCPEKTVALDARLSPAQNAQSYYKKYAKLKTGEVYKSEQIKKTKAELAYLDSVADSLSRASTDDDFAYIREELVCGGYMKKDKVPPGKKPRANVPVRYVLPSGRFVYCGKNNAQNDYIDQKLASKNDYWFHVKNYAGSHVVLVTDGTEPSDEDYTYAAMLAAYNSRARGAENVAVDYTLVKNLKKPAKAAPGFVTYLTNYTAYVDAVCPPIKEDAKK